MAFAAMLIVAVTIRVAVVSIVLTMCISVVCMVAAIDRGRMNHSFFRIPVASQPNIRNQHKH